ncbi:MAG: bifunctional folylpolyglutamate synthase/dihydrofolate synthase [Halanaerobiales bacterium]|nr:bifunctional folylpolyglutamate synthase/dihydrofolate synthase [Halanaerobiales bacterium]
MNPYKYLSQFKKYGKIGGSKPGLKRVKILLKYLDNPQDNVKYIHIGGSNGKGSTAAMLTYILIESGYKVGTYISPPLIHFNERFKINNIPINTKDLTRIVKRIDKVFNDHSDEISKDEPSFFEIITVIAFIYFEQKNIDIGVLEVGLGGRLDATNVIKSPIMSIITNISLEHADILGPTIKDISREKAGIIKNKKPLITATYNSDALEVFKEITNKRESLMVIVKDIKESNIKYKGLDYQMFSYPYKGQLLTNLKLNILGKHQIINAALAIKSLEYLTDEFDIKEEDIYNGFKICKWPGRLEVVNKNPDILLDGAHNVDGLKRLINFLRENIKKKKTLNIVISILKDKDYKEMINLFNQLPNKVKLIITKNSNERTLKPSKIKEIADQNNLNNIIITDLYKAVNHTVNLINKEDVLCITGSLYTVSEARFYLYALSTRGLYDVKKK